MPKIGEVFRPWFYWGGVTVPGWLLLRPELSLGAKLLAALLMNDGQMTDQATGQTLEVGVADPVETYVRKYHGDRRTLEGWLRELVRQKLLFQDEEGKVYIRFSDAWYEHDSGCPTYKEHRAEA